MREKRKTCLNNVSVFAFSNTVVFRSVRWGCKMGNACCGKKRTESNEFSTIIRIKSFDFELEMVFHNGFESNESFSSLGFRFERIKPCISGILIDKD